MRHLKKKIKLSKKTAPRDALIRGLATKFFLLGKIKTTLARAKALQGIVETYITLSKKNTLTSRRALLSRLYEEKAVNKLLSEIGPKYALRNGGYTRIIKLGERRGDNAPTALLELV